MQDFFGNFGCGRAPGRKSCKIVCAQAARRPQDGRPRGVFLGKKGGQTAVKIAIYTLGCKVNQYETQALRQQFQLNLQMGADRVNSAVEASRLPSYDPEFRNAWNQYLQDER